MLNLMNPNDRAKVLVVCDAATPGPWSGDSYCRVFGNLPHEEYDKIDEQIPDCPEKNTEAFWKWYFDTSELRAAADELDPLVCTFPATHGDTASRRRQRDALFISYARTLLPAALRIIGELQERVAKLEAVEKAANELVAATVGADVATAHGKLVDALDAAKETKHEAV